MIYIYIYIYIHTKKQIHKHLKMTVTRHNKILYTWKKQKLTKNQMRIKENKEKKSSKLESENFKSL